MQEMPFQPSLKTLFLLLSISIEMSSFRLSAEGIRKAPFRHDEIGGFKRFYPGKDGFRYELVTKFVVPKNAGPDQLVEEPELAGSGSPLYMGKQRGHPEVRVSDTLAGLHEKRRLLRSLGPTTSGAWQFNSLEAKLSREAVEQMLLKLGSDPELWKSVTANMTQDKSKLLRALLFESTLSLSTEMKAKESETKPDDHSRDPTFESLSRSVEDPAPQAVRIPIPITRPEDRFDKPGLKNSVKYAFTKYVIKPISDTIAFIYPSQLRIHFSKKQMEFKPGSNSIEFILEASSAELLGDSRYRGGVRGVHEYFRHAPFYGEINSRLESGTIGPFKVKFSIQLHRPKSLVNQSTGQWFWRVDFVNSEKPITFESLETKPKVQLKFEHKKGEDEDKDPPPDLTKNAQEEIENMLAKTIGGCLDSVFFPDDFGLKVPIRPVYAERARAPSAKTSDQTSPYSEPPNSEFEIRLSDLRIEPDGIRFSFDSRFSRFQGPLCMSEFLEAERVASANKAKLDLLDASGTDSGSYRSAQVQPAVGISNEPWVVLNSVPKVSENSAGKKTSIWALAAPTAKPTITVSAGLDALDQLSKAAQYGGLYCVSTRRLWSKQRPTQLIEYHSNRPPVLDTKDGQLIIHPYGEIVPFVRSPAETDANVDKFVEEVEVKDGVSRPLRNEIDFELGVLIDPKSEKVLWTLRGVNIKDANKSEQDFINAILGPDILNGFFRPSDSEKKDDFLSDPIGSLRKTGLLLTNFTSANGEIQLSFDSEGLDWLFSQPKKVASSDKSELETLPEPKTVKVEMPAEISGPSVAVRWVSNPALNFSVRAREQSNPNWEGWSPFEPGDQLTLSKRKSGRYYVEVKAMNQGFEIEKTPARYEFYYQAPPVEPDPPTPPVLESRPSTDNTKTDSPKIEPKGHGASKGFFGCSLSAPSEFSWADLWIGFAPLLLALFFFLQLRIFSRKSMSH